MKLFRLKKPIKIHKLLLLSAIILLITTLVVLSPTYNFLKKIVDLDRQNQGFTPTVLSVENFLAGAPIDALTIEESSECQQARPQYTVITCDAKTPDAITIIRGEGDWPESDEEKIFIVPLSGGVQAGVTIQSNLQQPRWFWNTNSIEIWDLDSETLACTSYWFQFLGGDSVNDGCANTKLTYGKAYKILSDTKNQGITILGSRPKLYASNPDWGGGVELQIPGTDNCIYQNWLQGLKVLEASRGNENLLISTEDLIVSDSIQATKDLSSDDIKKISAELQTPGVIKTPYFEQPKFFTQAPTTEDASVSETRAALIVGDQWMVPYAYVEKANIYFNEYEGLAVTCDPLTKSLYGFKKYELGSNICYTIPEPAYTFISQDELAQDEVFCCGTNDCVGSGLSTNYKCQDYICVKNGNDTTGCISDNECRSEYWTDGDGTDIYLAGKCTIPTGKSFGTCNYTRKELNCRPDITYPNNMCCVGTLTIGFNLQPCAEPLRSCEQTFGQNACCLETQNYYTLKQCSGEQVCCGAETDGIGNCLDRCEPLTLKEKLLNWFKETFNISDNTAKILMWIAIIIVILLLLYLLGPILASLFKIGGMRPPRYFGGASGGYGGSSGLAGGGNIIIIK